MKTHVRPPQPWIRPWPVTPGPIERHLQAARPGALVWGGTEVLGLPRRGARQTSRASTPWRARVSSTAADGSSVNRRRPSSRPAARRESSPSTSWSSRGSTSSASREVTAYRRGSRSAKRSRTARVSGGRFLVVDRPDSGLRRSTALARPRRPTALTVLSTTHVFRPLSRCRGGTKTLNVTRLRRGFAGRNGRARMPRAGVWKAPGPGCRRGSSASPGVVSPAGQAPRRRQPLRPCSTPPASTSSVRFPAAGTVIWGCTHAERQRLAFRPSSR